MRWAAGPLVVAACLGLPLALSGHSYYSGLVAYAAVLALFGLSINLTVGFLGLISFGHAAFFGLGAYAAGLLVTKVGLSFWAALILAPLPAAGLGALVGFASVRVGGAYFAIATLTTAEILRLVTANWIGLTRGPLGLIVPRPRIPALEAWGLSFHQYYLAFCLLALALAVEMIRRVLNSPTGRAWAVIRTSNVLAESIGIATLRERVVAISISGALAGFAGALFVPRILVLTPDLFSPTLSATGLLIAILGGQATLLGPVLGGAAFAVLPEMLRFVDEYRIAIFALVLLVVVRFQPAGLVGFLPRPRPAGPRAPLAHPVGDMSFARAAPLRADGFSKRFGGLVALQDVTLRIEPGELVGIIGPNGAGKTTCLSVISGFLEPTSGSAQYGELRLSGRSPHRAVAAGLVRTFQHNAVCPNLSVFDNVLAATFASIPENLMPALWRTSAFRERERERASTALACLSLVGLASRTDGAAKSLPYGEQKMLAIAMALAARPRLLLLDEPAAGLNHTEANRLSILLRGLRDRGLTLVVIDHNLRMMMALCDRIIVLDQGRCIAEGTPSQIGAHPEVVSAYLGRRRSPERADALG